MEQPPCRTADFITVFSDICEKTQKSFIRLLAPLKTFVKLALYKYTYSNMPTSTCRQLNVKVIRRASASESDMCLLTSEIIWSGKDIMCNHKFIQKSHKRYNEHRPMSVYEAIALTNDTVHNHVGKLLQFTEGESFYN